MWGTKVRNWPSTFRRPRSSAVRPAACKIQAIGRADPSRRKEHQVRHDPFSRLEQDGRLPRWAIHDFDALDRFAQSECDMACPHLVHQLFHDLPVQEIQQAFTLINKRHIQPQRGEHRSIFDADYASAHHCHLPGQPLEFQKGVAGQYHLAVHRDAGRWRRDRADRNKNGRRGDAREPASEATTSV